MRHTFALLLFAFAASSASADCQDVCTDGEALCVEVCSSSGFAGLSCVTKCSKTATVCVNKCTPEPKPEPEPDPKGKNTSLITSWKSAFPLQQSNLDVSSCCGSLGGGIAPVSPMCPYVLCKQPDIAKSKDRNWSGKLFDTNPKLQPRNIFSQCASKPTPVCSLLSSPSQSSYIESPSAKDLTSYRKQLEAFRRSVDFARTTGQISTAEQQQLLNAYKEDYRSILGKSK